MHGGRGPPLSRDSTTTLTEPYTPSCPAGTRVAWGYLAYDAVVPKNASGSASVTIRAHTAEPPSTPAADCSDCVLVADVPASAPASCPMGGPSPCPRDVYHALGGPPATTNELLELVITLAPTPDGLLGPMLSSWTLTYSCPPAM